MSIYFLSYTQLFKDPETIGAMGMDGEMLKSLQCRQEDLSLISRRHA